MKILTAALAAAAVAANLYAEPLPYPGPVVKTATAWEGSASLFPVSGFGIRALAGIEGAPVRNLVAELGAGYRWIEQNGAQTPLPGATLAAGWRFTIPGAFSVTPLAGVSAAFTVRNGGVSRVISMDLSARAAIRISGGDYLTLAPTLQVPVSGDIPLSAGIAVGFRSETPWIVPVAEVRPSVRVKPALFSPDGDGVDDEVSIAIDCKNRGAVEKWKLDIIAQDGTVFTEFSGTGEPPASIGWNGTGAQADREIEPASDYRIRSTTTDTLGRVRTAETSLTVDILVIREGDRYKIRVPDISFPSYSWTISAKESKALLNANRKSLERIATLFTRFPDYSLTVEGHANAVNWNDPKKFAKEQTDELIPLSLKRANSVKNALVLLGIDEKRIRTVGRGGTMPVANFADQKSGWKNRRVEFILEK
jgi:outer membrane protein OmpA-like peptidoglycan-associated protein